MDIQTTEANSVVIKPLSTRRRVLRVFLIIIMPILLLGGSIVIMTIMNNNKPEVEAKEIVEKAAVVDVLTAKFADIRPIIEVYGQTVANKQLNLRPAVSGEILQVSPNFKSGALVNKGELLFSIDPFAYEGALLTAQSRYDETLSNIDELKLRSLSEEISLKTAKQQLTSAQKDYDSAVILQKRNTISKKALDDKLISLTQRQQNVSLSQNNIQAQKSQLQRLQTGLKTAQWSIDKAQRDLANTKTIAPFNAYVQNANMQIGQLTNSNEQVATLIDRSKMDIVFTISDGVYGSILAQDGTLIGREIEIIWQAGSNTKSFIATIDRVAAQITAASGGVELFAQINSLKDIATLRVGSFVTVKVPERKYENVLSVPEHVVYDGNLIYVLEEKTTEPKNDDEEPKKEIRLRTKNIKIVGYDGKSVLVVNADGGSAILDGDIILETKLSSAGDDILVITRDMAEKQRLIRLEEIAVELEKKKQTEADDKQKIGE